MDKQQFYACFGGPSEHYLTAPYIVRKTGECLPIRQHVATRLTWAEIKERLSALVKNERTIKHPVQQRYSKQDGPMAVIAALIVKKMSTMGYPAKAVSLWRSPEQQEMEYRQGDSKARAWQSPHQFMEAVDIIHQTKGWKVTDAFWDALDLCARAVAKDLDVQLETGYSWGWDKAHVEIATWREVRQRQIDKGEGFHKPTPTELVARMKEVLPKRYWPKRQEHGDTEAHIKRLKEAGLLK